MSTPTSLYWHALNIIIEQNLWKLVKSAENMGGIEALFWADETRLLEAGVDPSITTKIIAGRKSINPEREWEKLSKLGIQTLDIESIEYPKHLKEIPSPPPILYIRGDSDLLRKPGLAVVGSRKITSYGKQVVDSIVPAIANLDISIISGMAFGVDAAALKACIELEGKPIGVLASSLHYPEIGPKQNWELARKIEQYGCLVSENPPGRFAQKLFFPLRNRIVSGLSVGVLVIEAALKSGSLITAHTAVDQNREVFAVPGPIFSQNSQGTLDLIKRGARCVTNASDIAYELGLDLVKPKQLELNNPTHKIICDVIHKKPLSIDEIAQETKLPIQQVMTILTELELSNILRKGLNGVYAKIK